MYPLVFLFEERQRSSFQRRPLSASRKCKFACSLNANIVLRTGANIAAFGSFSFATSLWNDKEMASMPAQRGAKLYARQKKKLLEI